MKFNPLWSASVSCFVISFLFWMMSGFSYSTSYGQAFSNNHSLAESENKVFVVTNRIMDTTVQGTVIFTNQIDSVYGLKFLTAIKEREDWYVVKNNDLEHLLANATPYPDWLAWVHGDGQSFLVSVERALEIQQLHKVNMLIFSWPSKAPDKSPIGNFKNSRINAVRSAPYLNEFIHLFNRLKIEEESPVKLSIFFHSLANYMLESTIEQGFLDDVSSGLFENLILNAAATDSEGHRDWVERLNFQKRLFITSNDGDVNLAGLRAFSRFGYQLGEKPLEPLAHNATYLDFTESVGFRLRTGATHSYYYAYITRKSINIRELFTQLLQGKEVNLTDHSKYQPLYVPNYYRVGF